jgi:hypothetical protein
MNTYNDDDEIDRVIPAQPGFELLYLYKPDSEPAFGWEPIIAWRISKDHQAAPIAITPRRSSQYIANASVLYPDEQVLVLNSADGKGVSLYPNVKTWIVEEHEGAKRNAKLAKVSDLIEQWHKEAFDRYAWEVEYQQRDGDMRVLIMAREGNS